MDYTNVEARLVTALAHAKEGQFEKAIFELEELNIVQISKFLIYVAKMGDKVASNVVNILELIIQVTQEIYNNSELISPLHDEEFDQLYEIYKALSGNEIVGAQGNLSQKVFPHKYPDLRGTLAKVHFVRNKDKKPGESRRSLEDYLNSISDELDASKPVRAVATYKWDGISVVREMNAKGMTIRTLKRGNTDLNEAEEIPGLFNAILNKDYGVPYGMKEEAIISLDDYKALCKEYGEFKSPRSALSSIINSKTPDTKFLKYITLKPLRIQKEGQPDELFTSPINPAFDIPDLRDFDAVEKTLKDMQRELEENEQFDVDGIVISLIDSDVIKALGRDKHINKFEIAFKLPPKQQKTIIRDVLMSVGIHGAVTPVAKLDPVRMRGNTVTSPSLGSMNRFRQLGLAPGDEVILKYDIIPYLDVDETCRKSGNPPFKAPTHCSFCDKPLVDENVPRCVNEDCQSRVVGKLINFAEKMNFSSISTETIQLFWAHGILKNVVDFYKLEEKKLQVLELDRMAAKSFKAIINGIEKRKEVYDYELLGSLGITSIGRRMFKRVMEKYTVLELLKLANGNDMDALATMPGIKEVTSRKILIGVKANQSIILELLDILKVKRDNREYKSRVVFTKIRDKEFEEYLASHDVLVMDKYRKETDVLVVPDYNTSSSKVTKAQKDGKKILSMEDAYVYYNYKEATT